VEDDVPVYEYACTACGAATDRLLSHERADRPGPCPACDADGLRRRFSRVAVTFDGWGFSRNDALIADRPGGRGDFRQVKERAERISDGGG
jgi:putative FmdB family regulatory protein